jgi:hypothetical protein
LSTELGVSVGLETVEITEGRRSAADLNGPAARFPRALTNPSAPAARSRAITLPTTLFTLVIEYRLLFLRALSGGISRLSPA